MTLDPEQVKLNKRDQKDRQATLKETVKEVLSLVTNQAGLKALSNLSTEEWAEAEEKDRRHPLESAEYFEELREQIAGAWLSFNILSPRELDQKTKQKGPGA